MRKYYDMGAIEELIQQTKFKNEHHRSVVSLIFVGNLINDHLNTYFKKFGITGQQYNVLRILRGQHPKPATVNLIRERMLDKNSDASRIVERLRKAALVERLTCPKDRRAVDVLITKKGLDLLTKIDASQKELDEPVKSLSATEVKQLNSLLDKVLTKFTS